MANTTKIKLYGRVGRGGGRLLDMMQKAFDDTLGQVYLESHQSRLQNGEPVVETASLIVYGNCESTLQFYLVTDDRTKLIHVSILGELSGPSGDKIQRFLCDVDDVTTLSPSMERSPGPHAFAEYLEEPYTIPRNGPFAVR